MKTFNRIVDELNINTKKKGITLMCFAIFTLLSLITFNPNDACFNVVSDTKTKNIFGLIGAYYADILIQIFGLSIYLVFPLLFYVSINFIIKRKIKYIYYKTTNTIISMVLFSWLLAYIPVHKATTFNISGVIGIFLSNIFSNMLVKIFIIPVLAMLLLFYVYSVLSKEKRLSKKIFNYLNYYYKTIKYCLNKLFFILKLIFVFPNKEKKKKVKQKDDEELLNEKVNDKQYEEAFLDKNIQITKHFLLPNSDLLTYSTNKTTYQSDLMCKDKMINLEKILGEFGIRGKIIDYKAGPIVTLYEFKPQAGTKSSRVTGLADDIARMMKVSSVRISTIVGKDTLSIEVPNTERSIVCFRKLIESNIYVKSEAILPLILGCNIFGKPIVADLTSMPHLLIAGTTGSGKSVGINGMLLSMLYKIPPEKCRFIMIDPKMLEFSLYDGIPNLLMPVITDAKKAVLALKWVVNEMENRYKKMSEAGVRNIIGYNEKIDETIIKNKNTDNVLLQKMPYIVVIIDEMADLMVVAGKEIEILVQRLSQMARAAGIHLIMATQRPSVDVITGVIKANFPTRIAYQVSSKIDSRTILGEQGAEQLLGKGDLLFMMSGLKAIRVHGPLILDTEVENVVNFIKNNNEAPKYVTFLKSGDETNDDNNFGFTDGIVNEENSDENGLYKQAVKIVLEEKKTSISYLQRKLRIGYNKAASFIEKMEEDGILSQADHTGKRQLLK